MQLQNIAQKYNINIQNYVDLCMDCLFYGYYFRYIFKNYLSFMDESDAKAVYRYALEQME